MVDIEKIKAEIERLQTLTADEFLAEEFDKMREEFEANKESKINDLNKALEIFDAYQVVEEQPVEEEDEQVVEFQPEFNE